MRRRNTKEYGDFTRVSLLEVSNRRRSYRDQVFFRNLAERTELRCRWSCFLDSNEPNRNSQPLISPQENETCPETPSCFQLTTEPRRSHHLSTTDASTDSIHFPWIHSYTQCPCPYVKCFTLGEFDSSHSTRWMPLPFRARHQTGFKSHEKCARNGQVLFLVCVLPSARARARTYFPHIYRDVAALVWDEVLWVFPLVTESSACCV